MVIKSLQRRVSLLLLLPVALLLSFTGIFGFLYARESLLDEWREAAILKLQRAAHSIDMRIGHPIAWIEMFYKTGGNRGEYGIQEWILKRLQESEGVTKVSLQWIDKGETRMPMKRDRSHMGRHEMMRFHRARISEVTPPRYDTKTGQETVTLISDLLDDAGRLVGRLEVGVRFDYLMQDIIKLGWWQGDKACLVDDSGRYLAHTDTMMNGRRKLGETGDRLEGVLLAAIRERPFGTILGAGHPPKEVTGFFKIKQAPWAIVLFAPGKKILAPVIGYLIYYSVGELSCLLFILLLIRSVVGNMVRSITEISDAAGRVATGNYGTSLTVRSRDEIGQLTQSFNTMVEGLKERDFIRNTFGRYVDHEIARELLKRPEAARLGGVKREVAILMSDIRQFTPLAESLSPDVIIGLLNRYFSALIEVIHRHQGIIVDFFGDSVLVFFDPLEGPLEPVIRKSIDCAFEMQEIMTKFNEEVEISGLPQLEMGIGVNSGEVVVGNIGSETRAKYGIVGSPVNITQRIQSEAKGGEVIISEPVYGHLSGELVIKRAFSIPLKGVKGQVRLYLVEGILAQKRDIENLEGEGN